MSNNPYNPYLEYEAKNTSQKEAIPGRTDMVKNNAGGYGFAVDDWTRMHRFLVLGTEGGTYYVNQRDLTRKNAEATIRCIQADGIRAVELIADISRSGRAPKNEPALFALALAASFGDEKTQDAAMEVLPNVARIGTHLFHFLAYVSNQRGWGRKLKNGIARWYLQKPIDRLAYQVVKYQQRNGWSHKDALSVSHPNPGVQKDMNLLFKWITNPDALTDSEVSYLFEHAPTVAGYEFAKEGGNEKVIIRLISKYRLTREMIPTKWLNSVNVWDALLENMPMTATIRNLGKMTSIGLIAPMNEATSMVVSRITDESYLRKSRVHPLTLLIALKAYQAGSGVRGSLKWKPVAEIVDALDDAFYLAFDNIEPAEKRTMLALDVSGSMTSGNLAGAVGVTPRVASGAMALATAKTEKRHVFTIFSSAGVNFSPIGDTRFSRPNGIGTIDLSPKMRLDDVLKRISGLPFGGTDCALPMLYALEQKMKVDTFVIYTDSETWAGSTHPTQALQRYRDKTGIPAKLVVVGMVSNGFTIADPQDAGQMDVVGFDTATPNVINDFSRGSL